MPIDPWALDSSGGTPAYTGQELRLGTLAPLLGGAGASSSLSVRSGVRMSGSGQDLLVQAQGTPNMSVLVHSGIAVVQGATTTTQGPYSYVLDSATTLTIAASHATLDRTDLICVRIRDASVDTSGARDGAVVVVQGTNGGGVPSVPTGATYLVLAQVFVLHAVTSITSGLITDKRLFLHAAGGRIPALSTNRPVGVYNGQQMVEVDTGLNYTWNSTASKWLRELTFYYKTANTTNSSNAAYTPVPEFVWTGEPGTYVFEGTLFCSAATAQDIAVAWTDSSGANFVGPTSGVSTNASLAYWFLHAPGLGDGGGNSVTTIESSGSQGAVLGIGGMGATVVAAHFGGALSISGGNQPLALCIRIWNAGGTCTAYTGSYLKVRQVA